MASSNDPSDPELFAQIRRALALQDAPPGWIDRASAIADRPSTLSGLATAAGQWLRRIQATLSFDSAGAPAVALGVRSAGPGALRHLLFSAEGRDIDLRIAESAAGYTVSGQVLGPDESGRIALRYPGEDGVLRDGPSASVDEFGGFALAPAPAGTVQVVLRLGHDEITLPLLTLGPAAA